VLLPGIDAELSPSRLNLGDDRLDEVLVARPDLAASPREILTVDFSDATERVAELRAASTETFNVLALTAAGAYYLDARVRDAIGYPGQEPTPVSIDSFPDYVAEGLLDQMLA
jgi:hypothetical protein